MFAAFTMSTMLLTQTSWKRLTFYKWKGKSAWTVDCYNRGLLQSSVFEIWNFWILQFVSPGLRCFQQRRRQLLKLFVLYLMTIDSDAALGWSTFEITHSWNFESRWLLPVWPFGELRFVCCTHFPAPNDLTILLIRNTTLKRTKKFPWRSTVVYKSSCLSVLLMTRCCDSFQIFLISEESLGERYPSDFSYFIWSTIYKENPARWMKRPRKWIWTWDVRSRPKKHITEETISLCLALSVLAGFAGEVTHRIQVD